jgi:hypothetical protein
LSSPFFQENSPGFSTEEYTAVAYNFTLNSTDITGSIIDPDIRVFVSSTGVTLDEFSVSFGFFDEDLGTPEGITYEQGLSDIYVETFDADLVAPLGSFGGNPAFAGLPTSLDFLGSLSTTDANWILGNSMVYAPSHVTSEVASTFIPTAPGSGSGSGSGTTNTVPEPGSLSLSLVGICALGFLVSRRFRTQGIL